MDHFGLVDYIVFSLLLLLSALIGVWFGFFAKQKQDSTAEYLMGGKNMGVFPISMSLIASYVSGVILLAFPAEMYVYGTQYWLSSLSFIFTSVIMSLTFLPVFFKLQLTSTYEYLELRFSPGMRTLGSVLFVVKVFLFMPILLYAPALAFNQVTGISVHLIVPIVCLVCVFYTAVGGLKAVVWADTLQTVLIAAGVATVLVVGTIKVGGVAEVLERNRRSGRLELFNFDPDPTLRYTFWTVLFGDTFNALCHCAVNQAIVQRCLSMSSMRKINITMLIFGLGMFFMISICCYTGILVFALYHDCDPITSKAVQTADQLMPYFVMNISALMPGLAGLFLAGLMSAALSSMSTGLNALSGVVYEDMIRPWFKRPITEKRASTIMKVVAAVIGIAASSLVLLVEKMGSLMMVVFSLGAITSSGLMGVVTLGIFFPWANTKGALAGCLSSVLMITWMSAGSQVAASRGQIRHLTKPTSVAGCPAGTINSTVFHLDNTIPEVEPAFALYRVSFMYLTLIGTLVGIVVGIVVSFLTGAQDPRDLNPDLLAPVVRRFLPRRVATEQPLNGTSKPKWTPLNGGTVVQDDAVTTLT